MTAIATLKAEIAKKQDDLAAMRDELAALERAEKQAVINEMREKILANGINPEDLFPSHPSAPKAPPARNARNKVAPKYRDPVTGATWSGRGRSPVWMQGKDKAQFLIATGAPVSTTEVDAQDQVPNSHVSPETVEPVGSPSSQNKVGVVPSDETRGDAGPEPTATAADAAGSCAKAVVTAPATVPRKPRSTLSLKGRDDTDQMNEDGNAGPAATAQVALT